MLSSSATPSFQLVDQAFDHRETAIPEAGICGIETERRQQLLVAKGAAGGKHLEIFPVESVRRALIGGVDGVHQAVAEGIGVDIERRMDEMRYVGPIDPIIVVEAQRRTQASPLGLDPDLANALTGQFALAPLIVETGLEAVEGDLAHHRVQHVLDLARNQDAPAPGLLLPLQ